MLVMSEDKLSGREVNKIKRCLEDKKKWERKNSTVMKGVNIEKVEREMREKRNV